MLPRSFFSGDQHDRTRNGEAKGFKLTSIWDLNDVQPLFRIPSSVFFAEKKNGNGNGKIPVAVEGKQFTGRLPAHNCYYDIAETHLKETSVKWHLIKQGKATAFSTAKSQIKNSSFPGFNYFEFLVESKTYVFYTNAESEADYLATILNSSIPNTQIKDFQTKGLFGPRDIHKKILDVYFPKYDASDELHKQLAGIGKICSEKAKKIVESNPPQNDLSAHSLGKLRIEIKKYLSQELAEIDKIVEKIMK